LVADPNIITNQNETAKISEEGANAGPEYDGYDEDLMKVWEEHMHDFSPSDILTYEIPSSTREV
jgi:hypothetical protein